MNDTHDKHAREPKDPDGNHFAPDFHHRNLHDRITALEDAAQTNLWGAAPISPKEVLALMKRVDVLEAKVTALLDAELLPRR